MPDKTSPVSDREDQKLEALLETISAITDATLFVLSRIEEMYEEKRRCGGKRNVKRVIIIRRSLPEIF